MIKLTINLDEGDLQWSDTVENKLVKIYYDNDISLSSSVNQYAVFSDAGFHGWLTLGFTLSEIYQIVKQAPIDYQDAYDNWEE
jgi:hypothetical protein